MGWKNSRDCQSTHNRRMERYGKIGREFEQEGMRKILQKMVDRELIYGFEIYPPYSLEDRDGKDIRVSKKLGDSIVDKYFGVTTSLRSWNKPKSKHGNVPQFCFPIGTNPATIERRVLELFEI